MVPTTKQTLMQDKMMVTLMWLIKLPHVMARLASCGGHPDVAGQSHPRRPYSPHVMTPLTPCDGHPDVAV